MQAFIHRITDHREVIWKGCAWLHACPCTQLCSRASEAGDCSAAAVSSKFLVHKGIVACFLGDEAVLLSLGSTGSVPGIQADGIREIQGIRVVHICTQN